MLLLRSPALILSNLIADGANLVTCPVTPRLLASLRCPLGQRTQLAFRFWAQLKLLVCTFYSTVPAVSQFVITHLSLL